MPFAPRRFLVAAALAVAGCGVAQQDFDKVRNDFDRCASELTRKDTDLASTGARLEEAKKARDKLQEDSDKLKAECAGCQEKLKASAKELDEVRRAHALAEQRREMYLSLAFKLRPLADAHTLAVGLRKGRMSVRIGEQALFEPDQAQLTPAGTAALRQVAAALREIPDRDFLVGGHTDNQPIKSSAYRSNWELSTARAVTVVRFLQAEGVDPRRLGAAGYSEFDSIARNDTAEERGLNRRIEIVVMPSLDELPAIELPPATPLPGATAPESASPAAPTPPPPAPLLR
ncbi:MAG TPA: OmpA family protein [Polyangia bacterium]|nr:OmpA family protein [Polyangia bacterium]